MKRVEKLSDLTNIRNIMKSLSVTERVLGFNKFNEFANLGNSAALRAFQIRQKNIFSKFQNISVNPMIANTQIDIFKNFGRFEKVIKTINQNNYSSIEGIAKKALSAHRNYDKNIYRQLGDIEFQARTISERVISTHKFTNIEAQLNVFRNIPDLSSVFSKHASVINKLSQIDYEVNSDGSISLENTTIPLDEITEAIEETFSGFFAPLFPQDLEAKLAKLKKPILAIVLYVLSLIVTYYMSVGASLHAQSIVDEMQPKIDSVSYVTKKDLKRTMKVLLKEYDLENIKSLRVVTGDGVRIRAKPRLDSEIFGLLYRGKLAKVLYKKNLWALVEITEDGSGETLTGWVSIDNISPLRR